MVEVLARLQSLTTPPLWLAAKMNSPIDRSVSPCADRGMEPMEGLTTWWKKKEKEDRLVSVCSATWLLKWGKGKRNGKGGQGANSSSPWENSPEKKLFFLWAPFCVMRKTEFCENRSAQPRYRSTSEANRSEGWKWWRQRSIHHRCLDLGLTSGWQPMRRPHPRKSAPDYTGSHLSPHTCTCVCKHRRSGDTERSLDALCVGHQCFPKGFVLYMTNVSTNTWHTHMHAHTHSEMSFKRK